MNWFTMMLNLEDVDGDLARGISTAQCETNYDALMKHLTPEVFCEFLQDIGLTANDAKSFLIKTLAKVEADSDEFDT